MSAKQILNKLRSLKHQLREVRDEIQDSRPEKPVERVVFVAARQGVEASEAELNSAIIALEHLTEEL